MKVLSIHALPAGRDCKNCGGSYAVVLMKDPFILKGAAGLICKGQLFQAFHLTLHGTMTVTDPGILLRLINGRSRSSDLPGTVRHDFGVMIPEK